jgi:hypothetical protein
MADQPQAAPARPAEPVQMPVDESHIVAHYANFCRVTGTPEELAFGQLELDIGRRVQHQQATAGASQQK